VFLSPAGEVNLENLTPLLPSSAIDNANVTINAATAIRSKSVPHAINDRAVGNNLVMLKNDAETPSATGCSLVKAQRFKREALIVAQRLARAEAELSRTGPPRLNDQNEPPFEVMLRLLALVCKRMSPKANSRLVSPMFGRIASFTPPTFLKFS
jgi:hypothetical protein